MIISSLVVPEVVASGVSCKQLPGDFRDPRLFTSSHLRELKSKWSRAGFLEPAMCAQLKERPEVWKFDPSLLLLWRGEVPPDKGKYPHLLTPGFLMGL